MLDGCCFAAEFLANFLILGRDLDHDERSLEVYRPEIVDVRETWALGIEGSTVETITRNGTVFKLGGIVPRYPHSIFYWHAVDARDKLAVCCVCGRLGMDGET